MNCELCGKPGVYPNFILAHGHAMHVGCMADNWWEMLETMRDLIAFWDNGTPVHPGAEVVSEAKRIISKIE